MRDNQIKRALRLLLSFTLYFSPFPSSSGAPSSVKEGGGEEKEMRSEGGWKRGGEEKERREAATTIFPSARRPLSLQCRPRPREEEEEEEEEAASSQGRRRCLLYSKCMKTMVVRCWWRMPAGALVSAQTFFHTYTVLYILSLRSLAFSLDQRLSSSRGFQRFQEVPAVPYVRTVSLPDFRLD